MIHDYNTVSTMGVKKAVKDFETRNGSISKLPICDCAGSLVITK